MENDSYIFRICISFCQSETKVHDSPVAHHHCSMTNVIYQYLLNDVSIKWSFFFYLQKCVSMSVCEHLKAYNSHSNFFRGRSYAIYFSRDGNCYMKSCMTCSKNALLYVGLSEFPTDISDG